MTPADHNKVIGIMHLIYGGFFTLVSIFMLIFFGFFAALLGSIENEPGAPPVAFIYAVMGFIFVLYTMLSLPGLVAGYAMLRRKSWAKVAGIVSSVLAALSFPFGTALCVYSLWYFFGEAGRAYEQAQSGGGGDWRAELGQGSTYGWDAGRQAGEREHAYRPPSQPPSWRE